MIFGQGSKWSNPLWMCMSGQSFFEGSWFRPTKILVEDQSKSYPLVNCPIIMENHHAIRGKTHYFDWAIFNSKLFVITTGYRSPFNSGITSVSIKINFSILQKKSGDKKKLYVKILIYLQISKKIHQKSPRSRKKSHPWPLSSPGRIRICGFGRRVRGRRRGRQLSALRRHGIRRGRRQRHGASLQLSQAPEAQGEDVGNTHSYQQDIGI